MRFYKGLLLSLVPKLFFDKDAMTCYVVEIAKLSVLTPVLLFSISEHKRDCVFNPEDAFGQG
jgi:hypothetical protein